MEVYVERITKGPCFICEIIADNPDYPAHFIHEDEQAIVFLSAYPVLYGYTLIAPRAHREQVTGDFTQAEYLRLDSGIDRRSQRRTQFSGLPYSLPARGVGHHFYQFVTGCW